MLHAADKANRDDKRNIVRTKEIPCVALFKGSHCSGAQENKVWGGAETDLLTGRLKRQGKGWWLGAVEGPSAPSFHLWGGGTALVGSQEGGHCSLWGT